VITSAPAAATRGQARAPVRGSSSTGSSHSILSLLSASAGRHPRRLPGRNRCRFGTQRELPRPQSMRAQENASYRVFSRSGLGAEDDHLSPRLTHPTTVRRQWQRSSGQVPMLGFRYGGNVAVDVGCWNGWVARPSGRSLLCLAAGSKREKDMGKDDGPDEVREQLRAGEIFPLLVPRALRRPEGHTPSRGEARGSNVPPV
jgi:hypothetical protein